VSGEKILVVEDEEPMRLLLSTFLTGEGYQPTTVGDGLQGLRAVQDDRPDIIITDVNVPGINGFELTRRLRADHRTARIPIIMLSGRSRPDDVVAGYAEGADEYVTKPVQLQILGAKVQALLRRTRAATEPKAHRGTVVAFLRGKGGIGLTTLAVNTAVALAQARTYRVALLDLSLEFGNAAMLLDIRPGRSLAHLNGVVITDLAEESFAPFLTKHDSGVKVVVGADSPEKAELVTVPTVQQTLDRLRAQADYVIVDTAPAFSEVTLAALDAADVICVVTAPRLAALKATADCLSVLDRLQVPKDRTLFVVNRVTPRGLDEDQIEEFFQRRPDLVIPHNPQLDDAADAGVPWVTSHPTDLAAIRLQELAAKAAARVPAHV
jgi:pilus assembly protein CpaE